MLAPATLLSAFQAQSHVDSGGNNTRQATTAQTSSEGILGRQRHRSSKEQEMYSDQQRDAETLNTFLQPRMKQAFFSWFEEYCPQGCSYPGTIAILERLGSISESRAIQVHEVFSNGDSGLLNAESLHFMLVCLAAAHCKLLSRLLETHEQQFLSLAGVEPRRRLSESSTSSSGTGEVDNGSGAATGALGPSSAARRSEIAERCFFILCALDAYTDTGNNAIEATRISSVVDGSYEQNKALALKCLSDAFQAFDFCPANELITRQANVEPAAGCKAVTPSSPGTSMAYPHGLMAPSEIADGMSTVQESEMTQMSLSGVQQSVKVSKGKTCVLL